MEPLFKISLAEWSLHRTLQSGKLDHLDFPKVTREDFGIDAIELVNSFFKRKAQDEKYLAEFKKRADDFDVKTLLIMCDFEGDLGNPHKPWQAASVEKHRRWLEAAAFLGCHSIRVNARSRGNADDRRKRLADGLRKLCGHAAKLKLNVLIENHGGLSSNGAWLVSLIREVNLPNCGTLPDFGNFKTGLFTEYDRYQGVTEMMPYAKAVSAKAMTFNKAGDETGIDYRRMTKIVLDAGYRGYFGIEYSGRKLSEPKGILATKHLMEKIRDEFA